MAFAQHVVDCVGGPLSVAWRMAKPHWPELPSAGQAGVAPRHPAGEALRVAVDIVQRAPQRRQAAAEVAR